MKFTIADIKHQLRAYGNPVGTRIVARTSPRKPWLKTTYFQCYIVLPPASIDPDYPDCPPTGIGLPTYNLRYLYEGQIGYTWMEAWLKLRNELWTNLEYIVKQIENERKNR